MEQDGLTNEQTEKVLQFQDLTGIEDINICRDVLIRHQWDLEIAIQEQLNIREGRPSMYAASTETREPQVVNDRFLQQVFSATRTFAAAESPPSGITGFLGYLVNCVFQFCYSTLSSVITTLLNIFRSSERIVTDPLGDVMNFIQAFSAKYPQHPTFYQGTYAQALNDAKRELRFLLVYLHSETSNQQDVQMFCSQSLADEGLVSYVNDRLLLWGCDVASPEGYRVSHSVNARTYPTLVLIGLRSNKMVIMARIEGFCTGEEMLRRLQIIVNDNQVWLDQARSERLESSLRHTLRQQQDEAYEQSLRADEEKERRRQHERDQQLRLLHEEEELRRVEQQRKDEITNLKIELASRVPSEPPNDAPNAISVVFKLPNGARIERRFLKTDSLQDVYNYIFCHPASPDTFEITTNFPKRVLYTNNSTGSRTLIEVGLKNREVLFVNDLDA